MGKSQGKWADEAARALGELLPVGTPVTLELGIDACDVHGRVLTHIYKDGQSMNAEMVKRGLAVNYCVAPDFAHCDEFSDTNVELPYDFRRRIGNNPQRSYVGDIQTKAVLTPGHQNDVPIANRVFFYTKEDVKDPYHISE